MPRGRWLHPRRPHLLCFTPILPSANFLQFALGSMAHIVRCSTYYHFPANCSLAGEYFMPQEMLGLYLHLGLSWSKKVFQPKMDDENSTIWVCLKMGYTPNEIAIFHRDNDQQNHWVQWGTRHFQTNPYVNH